MDCCADNANLICSGRLNSRPLVSRCSIVSTCSALAVPRVSTAETLIESIH